MLSTAADLFQSQLDCNATHAALCCLLEEQLHESTIHYTSNLDHTVSNSV